MATDPTKRFSTRAENYAKYRPPYPLEVLDILREECGLVRSHVVADVGSGTGLLTVLFLRNGNRVCAVEPNEAMREAAERDLRRFPTFVSIAGRAEDTTLPSASVDMVTSGQAFQWFDHSGARAEFARILRPGGWVVLVWNRRRTAEGSLQQAIQEAMRRVIPDYEEARRRHADEGAIRNFYGPHGFGLRICPNQQVLNWPALRGNLLSHSSVPEPGQLGHEETMTELRRLFGAHQQDGRVVLEYDTKMYFGRLDT
jgi:SAM-dependent methyltransferase